MVTSNLKYIVMSGAVTAPGVAMPVLQNIPGKIYVNRREKFEDRVVRCLRHVGVIYTDEIAPDFIIGSTCALSVDLSYHQLHENYIKGRMKAIGRDFKTRILLVVVDSDNNLTPLLQLNKLCFNESFTLILAWSYLEAARYIESFKVYETKPATSIQEKVDNGFEAVMTKVLTTVPGVNKTDAATLLSSFDSFRGICFAEEHHLLLCQGIGEKKMKRLHQVLHQPLNKKRKSSGEVPQEIGVETDGQT